MSSTHWVRVPEPPRNAGRLAAAAFAALLGVALAWPVVSGPGVPAVPAAVDLPRPSADFGADKQAVFNENAASAVTVNSRRKPIRNAAPAGDTDPEIGLGAARHAERPAPAIAARSDGRSFTVLHRGQPFYPQGPPAADL